MSEFSDFFAALDEGIDQSAVFGGRAFVTQPYAPPVDVAAILGIEGEPVTLSGNATNEGHQKAIAVDSGKLDKHPEDTSPKTQAPILVPTNMQRNCLVRDADDLEIHQLVFVRRAIRRTKDPPVPQFRCISSMNYHLCRFRKLPIYQTYELIRKEWNFYGALVGKYAHDPLSYDGTIPYNIGIIAVDKVASVWNYWMTCEDPLKNSTVHRALWLLIKKMKVRMVRVVRDAASDWTLPVSIDVYPMAKENTHRLMMRIPVKEAEEPPKMPSKEEVEKAVAASARAALGIKQGETELEMEEAEEENMSSYAGPTEPTSEEKAELAREEEEKQKNEELCWQIVPYVTIPGEVPPVSEYCQVENGWSGGCIFVGHSSFVHGFSQTRAKDINRYIYARDPFWHQLVSKMMLCDVLLSPKQM